MVGRRSTGRTYAPAWLVLAAPFMLSTCSSPTDPAAGIMLQLVAPASVFVQQRARLVARAMNEHGTYVGIPQPLGWWSSDTTVASVDSTGVLKGLRRGTAVITARAGDMRATVELRVKARVRIAPVGLAPIRRPSFSLAVGDSLQFLAHYVDIDGAPINETPSATWTSTNGGVSINASGLAVGAAAWSSAVIRASTDDGLDSAHVSVSDAVAGQPAAIRFAHAVRDAGPLTFYPSKGTPVILSFGESVELPVPSGVFYATAAWAGGLGGYDVSPAVIRGGDRLELYAINTPPGLASSDGFVVVHAWAKATNVLPSDSSLVRFIQSSPFIVFYVRPPSAPASGNPTHCYFDPGDQTQYLTIASGDFDVILKYKGLLSPEIGRIRASAPAGRAATYVISGETAGTVRLLAFPDR